MDPREDKLPSIKKNYIFNTLYQLLSIITPLITAPYTSRVLGADNIGIQSFTSSNTTVFTLIAVLGTATYGQREIAMARNDRKKSSRLFWEIELISLISSVFVLALWAIWLYMATQYRIYYAVLTVQILAVAFDISWYFGGFEKFGLIVARNAAIKIVGIIVLFALVRDGDDLLLYMALLSITGLLGNLSMWLSLKGMLDKVSIKDIHPFSHLKNTIAYFIPSAATSVYTILDKSMIGFITGSEAENGYYEQANKVISLLKSLTFNSINGVMGVRISYLFEQTMDDGWDSFHLSAGMCVQHRRDVTRKLFEALKSERKVLCVSTQVIEAGVDVSFGQVIRFEAGMDSVIQSAGRCNRNGEYNSLQPVYLINCTDERLGNLPEIQKGKDATTSLVDAFQRKPEMFVNNLMSRQAIDYYYKTLYSEMAINAQDYPIKGKGTILDLLSNNTVFVSQMGDREKIQSYYLRQAFKTAGECFNVFDEDTIDVLVPYGEGKDLIVSLTGAEADYNLEYRKHLIEKASLYTVSIYREQKKQWESIGALYSICEGSIIVMREEFYDRGIGIRKIAGKQSFLEV